MSEAEEHKREWLPRMGRREWSYLAALTVVTTGLLAVFGRRFWCSVGDVALSTWDVSSGHLSQHLADPYSFTHFEHGILFFAGLTLVFRNKSLTWRFLAALTIAAGWEVLENSSWVIDRYREQTIDAGYYGDSIANALSDMVWCAAGFLFTARFRWWALAVMIAFEVALALTIRDNLFLNILMLLHSFDVILDWQAQRPN